MSQHVELPSRRIAVKTSPAHRSRRLALYCAIWILIGLLLAGLLFQYLEALNGSAGLHAVYVFLGWCLLGSLSPLIWWLTYERARQRELAASRLEGQLAQAHLQLLKMQLHPHFLFNTLNSISALMHRDVDASDRMIAQLSDLLRLSLERDERTRVRLRTELDFLKRYLDLEQIRFRDRLEIVIDVEPKCLEARVPRLILQPLVENAIRHGIALRSAAGRLEIRAGRRDERLRMCVADDGPGIPSGRLDHVGVGLSNTLDRLEQLYGEDHLLELVNAEEGGLEVLIEIPFETARTASP